MVCRHTLALLSATGKYQAVIGLVQIFCSYCNTYFFRNCTCTVMHKTCITLFFVLSVSPGLVLQQVYGSGLSCIQVGEQIFPLTPCTQPCCSFFVTWQNFSSFSLSSKGFLVFRELFQGALTLHLQNFCSSPMSEF